MFSRDYGRSLSHFPSTRVQCIILTSDTPSNVYHKCRGFRCTNLLISILVLVVSEHVVLDSWDNLSINSTTLVAWIHNLMIVTRNYHMARTSQMGIKKTKTKKFKASLSTILLPSLSNSLALCRSRSLSASIEDNSRCWLLIISNIVSASWNENSLLKVKTSHLSKRNTTTQTGMISQRNKSF